MLSFQLSLIGERMLGDREVKIDRSMSVRLDAGNDKVRPLGYNPMTEYPIGSQQKEPWTISWRRRRRKKKKVKKEEEERRLRLLVHRVMTIGHSSFLVLASESLPL